MRPVLSSRTRSKRPVIQLPGLVILLLLASSAKAFINLDYTTLDQVEVRQGDFNEILASGKLRILVPRDFSSVDYLPRRRSPLAEQQRIATEFALSHGLTPQLVIVENFAQLIPALEQGRGDIIINNLTINDQRLEKIAFSVPVDHVFEQILVASDNRDIQKVRDLNGKRVMVNRDSTFWHALQWLKKNRYPDIEVIATPDRELREQILDYLAAGEIDATIMDSNLAQIYASYRDDFKIADNFSGQRNIAWGIRKNAPRLRSEINRYLQLEYNTDDLDKLHQDDLDAIRKRRVLRVLLRNNAASYFLYRGELLGFEYELARQFADYHGLRLEVMVPPGPREMNSWLLEGRADIALGFLAVDDDMKKQGLAYSDPYHFARQHILVHQDNDADSLEELRGIKLAVRRHGEHWQKLQQMEDHGADFNLELVEDGLESEQLIQGVASGKYEAVIASEQVLNIELAKSVAVRSAYVDETEVAHAIALRASNPLLKQELDAFVKRVYRSEFYNVTYDKYFRSHASVVRLARGRVVDTLKGQISPYDKLVRKYADRYGFDWRLVLAQMYQESRFNPKAKSPAGAAGLMQLMPRTAKSMGVSKMADPDHSIRGGIKYLDWLRDRFSAELPLAERLWFTLASYNAGAGHVHDARRLAAQLGHDPDRWFGHTENAMLLLSKKQYAKKARYGYVNGHEPVNYVRQIKQRFEAYVSLSGKLVVHKPPAKPLLLAEALRIWR